MQKADVVIGNPPWLAYARMSHDTQIRFREEMVSAGLWGGMQTVSAFDLAAYFFIRCMNLYMKKQGSIAFVMPFAAMFKKPYAKFRSGTFNNGPTDVRFRIREAWALPSDVQPLFPVPSCVLFADLGANNQTLPSQVIAFSGTLSHRDAHPAEARKSLKERKALWPEDESAISGSLYRSRFRQGRVAELVEIGVAASPAGRMYCVMQQGQCIGRLVSR